MGNCCKDKYISIDIEANGLKPDEIYCLCVKTKDTDTKCYTKDQIPELKEWLSLHKDHLLVGHYIEKYDLPQISKLWGIEFDNPTFDTCILGKKLAEGLVGNNSLRDWGQRLGLKKGEIKDFSYFQPEMIDYCKNDVFLHEQLYLFMCDVYDCK